MPVKRFTSVEEAEDAYADLERENIELKVKAERSVSGFLSRNEKVLISLFLAIIAAIGGSSLVTGLLNREQIKEAKVTQQEIKVTTEETAKRTNEVGSGVDDVKRAVKQKGPFE